MTPEGWLLTSLGEVADVAIGGTPARNNPSFWDPQRTSGNAWVAISDLKGRVVVDTAEYISDLGVRNSNVKLVKAGTPLMSFKLTIGRMSLAGRDLYTNEAIAAFRSTGSVDSLFLLYALPRAVEQGAEADTAVKGKTLNKAKLLSVPVSLPPLAEQRKIASILSSLDDAIEATQAVIDQLQVVKQAMMAELLTRGLPGRHGRLKKTEIGDLPDEWDCVTLGDIAEFQPGYAFKSADFSGQGYRLLRGSNLAVDDLDWGVDKTVHFPAERVGEVPEYVLREGEIVVAMDRPFISDGFKVARIRRSDLPALLLQRVGRFRRVKVETEYLWCLLHSTFVLGNLRTLQKGSDLPHISKSEIESCMVPLPPASEQRSIGEAYAALEANAAAHVAKRRCIIETKHGLASALLSGEVRVTVGAAEVAA